MSSSSAQENVFSGMEPQGRREKTPTSPRMFDVFINHRGPDVNFFLALPIYKILQGMGVLVFLDSREMDLGDLFPSTFGTLLALLQFKLPYSPKVMQILLGVWLSFLSCHKLSL